MRSSPRVHNLEFGWSLPLVNLLELLSNVGEVINFDILSELDSGKLVWGYLRSSKFRIDDRLNNLVGQRDIESTAVVCNDLGELKEVTHHNRHSSFKRILCWNILRRDCMNSSSILSKQRC